MHSRKTASCKAGGFSVLSHPSYFCKSAAFLPKSLHRNHSSSTDCYFTGPFPVPTGTSLSLPITFTALPVELLTFRDSALPTPLLWSQDGDHAHWVFYGSFTSHDTSALPPSGPIAPSSLSPYAGTWQHRRPPRPICINRESDILKQQRGLGTLLFSCLGD